MPYLYFTSEEANTLYRCLIGGAAQDPPVTADQILAVTDRVRRQTQETHKVVREIVFEGSEAELREQLSRSLPEGPRTPGRVQITARTISNSLPAVEPA